MQTNSRQFDLLIVGGGFRTTALLASAPWLLTRRLGIVEMRGSLGGGDFHEYDTTSTSIGSRFLKDADPSLDIERDKLVREVVTSSKPVELPLLAQALDRVGEALLQRLSAGELIPQHAKEVRLGANGPAVLLQDGSSATSRHMLLATGRHELPSQALERWGSKRVLSGDFIRRHPPSVVSRSLGEKGPIVIAGSAHSAMSALDSILKRRDHGDERYVGRDVIVTQRSPARLYYTSADDARNDQVPGRERLVQETSICPQTGAVHRDSGLRGRSRDLFVALWEGAIPFVQLAPVRHLDEKEGLFDRAALIVQALGYVGRAPTLRNRSGEVIREADAASRFPATHDGRAIIDGAAVNDLSILRVDPTPPELRDSAAYGQGLNRAIARHIRTQLDGGRTYS